MAGAGGGQHYAGVDMTNLRGPANPTKCIRELSKSKTYQCVCEDAYTGRRCQTCKGCADGLACKDGERGKCTVAEGSIMAAFGFNVTTIQLSDENLHGDLPDMSSLVYLESLDVSNNPSLTDGPAWPWLVKMHNMKKINIDNTSRTTQPYGQQCSIDTGGTDAAVHENTCVPGSTCRSHCCGLGVPDTCGYCTNHNEGPCYTPLSVFSDLEDAKLALNSTNGWVSRYNKEEHATLKVPSDMANFIVRGGKQVSKSKIEFKLMWSENDEEENEESATPPVGLTSSGTELDPGAVSCSTC